VAPAYNAAASQHATAGSATAIRTPARAGPTSVPNAPIVLTETFAAVSCSGRETSEGSNADWAGISTLPTIATNPASAKTTPLDVEPEASSAAETAIAAARSRSTPSRIRSRR
jgi:hypothetical protein